MHMVGITKRKRKGSVKEFYATVLNHFWGQVHRFKSGSLITNVVPLPSIEAKVMEPL